MRPRRRIMPSRNTGIKPAQHIGPGVISRQACLSRRRRKPWRPLRQPWRSTRRSARTSPPCCPPARDCAAIGAFDAGNPDDSDGAAGEPASASLRSTACGLPDHRRRLRRACSRPQGQADRHGRCRAVGEGNANFQHRLCRRSPDLLDRLAVLRHQARQQTYLVSSNYCHHGVCGGPLVDAEGRLAGLTSGGPADRSFCLSLTAETARKVLAQIPIAIDAFPPNYMSNLARRC